MKCIIVFAALVGLSYQMSTIPHHTQLPHTTQEPNVVQQYIFHYDYVTHKMIVHKDRNCYIFTLSDQERMDVHTDSGLTALEIQFLTRISTGTTHEVSRFSVGHSITQACGAGVQHFYTVA